jgi:hypothetical protein
MLYDDTQICVRCSTVSMRRRYLWEFIITNKFVFLYDGQ